MQGVPTKKADALPLVALLIGNVALAFGPMFVRAADVGPVAAGFWRIALALPFLFMLMLGFGQSVRRIDPRLIGFIMVGGVCFAADLAAWHLGILRTTLANATLLGNSAVLFFPVYGFIAARAWPDASQRGALLLALVGAGLLMGRSYSLSHGQLVGDLLCLLAGVLYTGYFIVMARARDRLDPLPVLFISSAATAPPLLIAALAFGEVIWPQQWGPVIGLAIASQVVGQGLLAYAIGRLSPLVMGIGLLIQPIIGILAGWGWYGEVPGALDLLGGMLVAAALVLIRRTPTVAPAPASAD